SIDAQDMMPVIDFFQHTVQFAAEALVLADAKDLGDGVGGEAEHAEFARAFKDLVNRGLTAEDEIATVLDLLEGLLTPHVDRGTVVLRDLRPEDQGPIVQSLADDLGAEPVGGGLQ